MAAPKISNGLLTFTVKSKRPAPPPSSHPASKVSEITSKWHQRDLIIKEEASKAEYRQGDIVRPVDDEDFGKYGLFTVRGIVTSYASWPKHEQFPEAPKRPMITLIVNNAHSFNCTVNYCRKATPDEIEAQELKEKLLND